MIGPERSLLERQRPFERGPGLVDLTILQLGESQVVKRGQVQVVLFAKYLSSGLARLCQEGDRLFRVADRRVRQPKIRKDAYVLDVALADCALANCLRAFVEFARPIVA